MTLTTADKRQIALLAALLGYIGLVVWFGPIVFTVTFLAVAAYGVGGIVVLFLIDVLKNG